MKHSRFVVLSAFLAFAASGLSYGQEKSPSDLVLFYDSEFIKVNYQTFGGLSLQAQGFSSSTMMGIDANFARMLSAYPDSKASFESYRQKNFAGNVLLWGGLVASLGGAYYPLLSLDEYGDYDYGTVRTGLYVALGGLVAELVGAFLLPSSFQDLLNSVNLYNRNKLKEY